MDELPLLHQAVTRLSQHQIREDEFENIVRNCQSVNETDSNGDTALHLAIKIKAFREIKYLFEAGADPTIRNHQNLTPIDCFFADKGKNHEYNYLDLYTLFNNLQKFHPDSLSIVTMLQSMPFHGSYAGKQKRGNRDVTNIIKIYLLPLETLKSLLQWTEHKLNVIRNTPVANYWKNGSESSCEELKEDVLKEIQLVEKAFSLTEIIEKIVTKEPTIRNTILRTMLLGDPPLDSLLNDLAEEGLMKILPPTIKSAFKELCNEYEDIRLTLERLSARPDVLTKEEKAFVIPLCEKLQAIAYIFQDPNNNKEWQERVKSYEVRDQASSELESRYAVYKAKDLEKRQFVFDEFNKYKKYISDGTYLGTNGFLAKQKIRDKHADVAENRLSQTYKK